MPLKNLFPLRPFFSESERNVIVREIMWRVTPENYSLPAYHTLRKGAIIIFTAQYTASSRKKRQIKNEFFFDRKSNAVTRHFFFPPSENGFNCLFALWERPKKKRRKQSMQNASHDRNKNDNNGEKKGKRQFISFFLFFSHFLGMWGARIDSGKKMALSLIFPTYHFPRNQRAEKWSDAIFIPVFSLHFDILFASFWKKCLGGKFWSMRCFFVLGKKKRF